MIKKRGHKFEMEQRGLYRRVWREKGKKEMENMSLYYNLKIKRVNKINVNKIFLIEWFVIEI